MYYKILSLFFFLIVGCLNAQDAHFSQQRVSNVQSNPALTGMMHSENKLSGTYRTQWSAIPDAFKTYRVAFEQRRNNFAWGANLLSNDAGVASLKQSQVSLNLAYQKQLSKAGNILRAGFSAGAIQQRFNPAAFQFDNQYEEGVGFNAAMSNGEQFDKTNHILADISAGISFSNQIGKLQNEFGLAFNHINKPIASFYLNDNSVYSMRTHFHANTSFPINSSWMITGQLQFDKQGTASKTIVGGGVAYQLAENKKLRFGIANRRGDAWILSAGLKMDNIDLGLSYDAHQSKLAGATNGNGAIEFSAAYFFNAAGQKETLAVAETPVDENLKDSDNDGVPNGVDECPNIPGVWKFNGCNDKDNDDVYDSIDNCPNLFGNKLNGGCPMETLVDSDQDGLTDDIDDCPFLKGPAKFNGCPDTDEDGVSDKFDKCPFLKGNTDNNGCPKLSDPLADLSTENDLAKVHVEFDTDQSFIKAQYMTQLDRVVKVLMEDPTIKIYISGHTDAEGDPVYNYNLGQKRSMEVMQYFIERGISPNRVSIISYGETKPIGTNNTVYGKSRNRRAEVILLGS